MKDKVTPLERQYNQIKAQYPDSILLFRMGDFFETFQEDAVLASKACGLTLTKRNGSKEESTPLAGFPHHQLDTYLPKLVKAGYRVAVCEQLEDPKNARGIVRRGVVEVVTPGVTIYDKLLESKKNNYLAAISLKHDKSGFVFAGISYADISTGEFYTSEININTLSEVIESLMPAEIIISKSQKHEIEPIIEKLSYKPLITRLEPWIFDEEFATTALVGLFKTQSLKGFGIDKFSVGIAAAGAVLHYIKETQLGEMQQFTSIKIYDPSEYMALDFATRRNLEIVYSYNDGSSNGTLISILDKTSTPMGGRLFKKWITLPLRNVEKIHFRLSLVKSFYNSKSKRASLREKLSQVGDIERLISKVCSGKANPRDLISLKNGLIFISKIKDELQEFVNLDLTYYAEKLHNLQNVIDLIDNTLLDEPSTALGSGNIFKSGNYLELDEYINAKYNGKKWIADYQEQERQRTSISSLKVGYTSVFGYYIEITRLNSSKVPEDYQRKQTLTNAERYITPVLKEFEEKILSAEEKISEHENRIFNDLRIKIAEFTGKVQDNANIISEIDCLQSFAQSADEFGYVEPIVDDSYELEIKDGRHPIVERLLAIGEKFTPNSTFMTKDFERMHILTGPNMSGKSCYLRQIGLIVLLAQIGSYVPASSARIGLVDRIFTRVGAQDNITSGESTFLVEMQEAANILNNATEKSLILLDEVGRGTATFDGISLAWSIAEYINDSIKAKTLFATHYHELNDMATRYRDIANYKVEIIESGKTIIFTHNVKPGASDHSFGIHVAQMAGLPSAVIGRANEIMISIEDSDNLTDEQRIIKVSKSTAKTIETRKKSRVSEQLSIFEFKDDEIREKLREVDINSITPIQALQFLAELKKTVN
jgi:DNA mismatch repair protein MutS